jgi:hypothetical protein
LAGKRWEIFNIDRKSLSIKVEPSKSGKVLDFFGPGGVEVHPIVRKRMQALLKSNYVPEYLDDTAKLLLLSSRKVAGDLGLLKNNLIQLGPSVRWFTWTGSVIHETLWALGAFATNLKCVGDKTPPHDLYLEFQDTTVEVVKREYQRILGNPPATDRLAGNLSYKMLGKYDRYLLPEAKAMLVALNQIHMEAAMQVIRETL